MNKKRNYYDRMINCHNPAYYKNKRLETPGGTAAMIVIFATILLAIFSMIFY